MLTFVIVILIFLVLYVVGANEQAHSEPDPRPDWTAKEYWQLLKAVLFFLFLGWCFMQAWPSTIIPTRDNYSAPVTN